jgi:hypothetical protein
MSTTATQYATLDEVKAATVSGVVVKWQNSGYTVKQSKFEPEDFYIICCNGHCAFLSNDYKAEDFFSI